MPFFVLAAGQLVLDARQDAMVRQVDRIIAPISDFVQYFDAPRRLLHILRRCIGLRGGPLTLDTYTLTLPNLAILVDIAAFLQAAIQRQTASVEDCQRIEDGIDLNNTLKVAGGGVAALSGLITLFAPNPYTGALTVVARRGCCRGAISEKILQKQYDKLDCDRILKEAQQP